MGLILAGYLKAKKTNKQQKKKNKRNNSNLLKLNQWWNFSRSNWIVLYDATEVVCILIVSSIFVIAILDFLLDIARFHIFQHFWNFKTFLQVLTPTQTWINLCVNAQGYTDAVIGQLGNEGGP